jgi:hypothetical protein
LAAASGPWIGGGELSFERSLYLSSVCVATTGQLWPFAESRPLTGVFFFLSILVSGAMLRGSSPTRGWASRSPSHLVGRACFTWFEADNSVAHSPIAL